MATARVRRWFPVFTELYRQAIPREWKLAIVMLGCLMVDRWAADRLTAEQATRTRLGLGDLLEVTGCGSGDDALVMLRAIAKARAITIKVKTLGNGFTEVHWPKLLESLKSRRPPSVPLATGSGPVGSPLLPRCDPVGVPSSSSSSLSTDSEEKTDSQQLQRTKRPSAAPVPEQDPVALAFATDFRSALVRVHEGFKPPTPSAFNAWAKSARLLLKERPEAEVRALARWLFDARSPSEAASFWRSVVLSVPKFREKFEQIAARRRQEEERNGRPHVGAGNAAGPGTSPLAERAREHVRRARSADLRGTDAGV